MLTELNYNHDIWIIYNKKYLGIFFSEKAQNAHLFSLLFIKLLGMCRNPDGSNQFL